LRRPSVLPSLVFSWLVKLDAIRSGFASSNLAARRKTALERFMRGFTFFDCRIAQAVVEKRKLNVHSVQTCFSGSVQLSERYCSRAALMKGRFFNEIIRRRVAGSCVSYIFVGMRFDAPRGSLLW
jgi:hypothetical protein